MSTVVAQSSLSDVEIYIPKYIMYGIAYLLHYNLVRRASGGRLAGMLDVLNRIIANEYMCRDAGEGFICKLAWRDPATGELVVSYPLVEAMLLWYGLETALVTTDVNLIREMMRIGRQLQMLSTSTSISPEEMAMIALHEAQQSGKTTIHQTAKTQTQAKQHESGHNFLEEVSKIVSEVKNRHGTTISSFAEHIKNILTSSPLGKNILNISEFMGRAISGAEENLRRALSNIVENMKKRISMLARGGK